VNWIILITKKKSNEILLVVASENDKLDYKLLKNILYLIVLAIEGLILNF